MHYDLTDLRVFLAVAQAGNVTRGAETAHLAPSSASQRIRDLEQALGVALFQRNARGVVLTPAGEALQRHAREVLARLEQMHADLAPFAAGIRAHVSLFANTNATNSFLPDDLGSFLRAYPQVSITLEEHTSPDIVRAVAAGQADLGVVAGQDGAEGLRFLPYRQDRLVWVLPPGHPLAGAEGLRFAQVVGEPFVSLQAGTAIHTFTMNHAADLGRHLNVRIQVRSFDAVCRMVAAGVGMGMVPRSAVARLEGVRCVTVEIQEPWARRDLHLCLPAGGPGNPFVAALVQSLGSQALAAPDAPL